MLACGEKANVIHFMNGWYSRHLEYNFYFIWKDFKMTVSVKNNKQSTSLGLL